MNFLPYIGMLLLVIIILLVVLWALNQCKTKEGFINGEFSGTSEISDNQNENNVQARLATLENRVSTIDATLSTHFGTTFNSTDNTDNSYTLENDTVHSQYLKTSDHNEELHSSMLQEYIKTNDYEQSISEYMTKDEHDVDGNSHHDNYMKIDEHNNFENNYHDGYMRVDNHGDHSDYVLISDHETDAHEQPINELLSTHNKSTDAHNKTIQKPLKDYVKDKTRKHNTSRNAHTKKFRQFKNKINHKFDDYSLKTDLTDHNNVVDAHHDHDGVLNDHINSHMHGPHSHSDD